MVPWSDKAVVLVSCPRRCVLFGVPAAAGPTLLDAVRK